MNAIKRSANLRLALMALGGILLIALPFLISATAAHAQESDEVPNPVGYWRFETSTELVDTLNNWTNEIDGHFMGLSGPEAGAPDNNVGMGLTNADVYNSQSFALDGVDDYMTVDVNPAHAFTNAMTAAAWVKLVDVAPDQKIVGKLKLDGLDRSGYLLGVKEGKLLAELYDANGEGRPLHIGDVTANVWTHIALTRQTNGKITSYINGVQVGQRDASTVAIGTDCSATAGGCNVMIGGAPWSPTALNANGNIDEVIIFDKELSAAQVAKLAQRTFIVKTAEVDDTSCEGAVNCSLRGAITASNAAEVGALPNQIHFDLIGSDDVTPMVINPFAPLPTINKPVIIDGLTHIPHQFWHF